jgi:hypothetical protein
MPVVRPVLEWPAREPETGMEGIERGSTDTRIWQVAGLLPPANEGQPAYFSELP